MTLERSRLLVLISVTSVLFSLAVAADLYHGVKTNTVEISEQSKTEAVLPVVTAQPTRHLPLPVAQSESVWLAAVGDIMLSRTVADKIVKNGKDYPFEAAQSWLRKADIVFGNLETPLTPGRRVLANEMAFRADPELAKTMKSYNFSVVSLANNHTMNFGDSGMLDTLETLRLADILAVGAGANQEEALSPVYLEAKGLRFAFLAYNDSDVVPPSYEAGDDSLGTAFMNINNLEEGISLAKQQADFVIVSMHSGREYESQHSQRQEEFARAAIDYGAELVLGHHPHVIQDYEMYKGKYIFYSLGNFIFDQMWSQETKEGLGVMFQFNDQGVVDFELQPFLIQDYSQPRPLSGEAASLVISQIDKTEDK